MIPSPPLRVLIVDDSPTQLALLRRLFVRAGHAVVEAKNGAEALLTLDGDLPDVVVSDCRMPFLDGYQLCRLIKDERSTRHLPVLLLTAEGSGRDRFWARTCGANAFLTKERELDLVLSVATRLAAEGAPAAPGARGTSLSTGGTSADALLRRLSAAVEQRLLESTLRSAIASLYTARREPRTVVSGFLDLLRDLALPGIVAVGFMGENGPSAERVHGGAIDPAAAQAFEEALLGHDFFAGRCPELVSTTAEHGGRVELGETHFLRLARAGEPPIGVLALHLPGAIYQQHETLYLAAADELARLLELEQVHIELMRVAAHDALTGLWNRRRILEALDGELARSARYGQGLSVLLADVDHFKSVNDLHGHAAGDLVLKEVSRRFSQNVRSVDGVGRFGGEEFLIVCPQAGLDDARLIADRLGEQVARSPVPGVPPSRRITVSFGIASARAGEGRDALIARADAALYRAKEAGRNRVAA